MHWAVSLPSDLRAVRCHNPESVLAPDSSCYSSSLQPPQREWGREPALCDLPGRLSGHPGRRDSHIRDKHATWKGDHFCHMLLKQPVLWWARDRLVSLDRKQLEKSERTVRKIPASPYLVQEIFITSILQSQQPQLGKNYALAHIILFFGTTALESTFQAVTTGGIVLRREPEYLHLSGLCF